ncbi:hypothetical protein [Microlunatus sp. GCM10028923]|uniref:hypothetical protein n=1 Tax=Microlunatus sp. GCM10028923 TaxID=3273400 RepID=UPI00360F3C28
MATDTAELAELREFVERLQRDVAGVDPAAIIGIYDLEVEGWVVEPSPDRLEPPEDFGPTGMVGRIYGSDFLMLSGDEPPDGLAWLADRVQDDVMGHLMQSWPDVDQGGRTMHLEPIVHHGLVVWGHRSEPVCAIGELRR